MEFSINGIFS